MGSEDVVGGCLKLVVGRSPAIPDERLPQDCLREYDEKMVFFCKSS